MINPYRAPGMAPSDPPPPSKQPSAWSRLRYAWGGRSGWWENRHPFLGCGILMVSFFVVVLSPAVLGNWGWALSAVTWALIGWIMGW